MSIKLSEAIREGSKRRPQAFGHLFNKVDSTWGSCALGAALEQVFNIGPTSLMNSSQDLTALAQRCGIDLNQRCTDPQEQVSAKLHTTILRLNDEYHWTREEIAEWLASIGY